MQFKDKTFIVTGGASGLGAATTAAFIEQGAKVFVADVKGEAPEGATFVQTDVTDEASVTALVEQANANGTLAGVVNCAGIGIAQKTVGKSGPHDLAVLTRIVVDVGEASGVELELSSSAARTHGGFSCPTLTPG